MGTVLEATAGSGSDGVRDGAMDLSPVCPQCGYDLRGADTGRCPECGFDRALIADPTSTIPWTHRRELGRVRTWVRTVWQFTTRSRWLALEAARPVSVREAKRFWLITATLLSLPALIWLCVAWHDAGSLVFVAKQTIPEGMVLLSLSRGGGLAVFYNLILPWTAGATLPGLLLVCIWLAVVLCTGVHTYLFHPPGLDRRRADRCVSLSYYLCGVLVLPVGMLLTIHLAQQLLHNELDAIARLAPQASDLFLLLAVIVILGLLVNAYLRVLAALRQGTRCGWSYIGVAAVAMPLGWLACLIFSLGVIPWLVGYAWIMIDSFR